MKHFILIALLVACQKDIEEVEVVQEYIPEVCGCECATDISTEVCEGPVCYSDPQYRGCIVSAMIRSELRHGMQHSGKRSYRGHR